jgi:hypothetical protein
MEECVDGAIEEDLEEHARMMLIQHCWFAMVRRDLSRAVPAADRAVAYCLDHDMSAFLLVARGVTALGMLHRGMWARAAETAEALLAHPSPPPVCRVLPLVVRALLEARGGSEPEAWPMLDEALAAGEPTDLVRLGPVWEVRAEVAWLAGDDARAEAEARRGLTGVTPNSDSWLAGDWACRSRLGGPGVLVRCGSGAPGW